MTITETGELIHATVLFFISEKLVAELEPEKYKRRNNMSFVDELRRNAPTKAALKAKEEQEKREHQERINTCLQKECAYIVRSLESLCKSANERGEKRYTYNHEVEYGVPGYGLGEKEKKAYAKRLCDMVSEELKKDGFRVSVRLGKTLYAWWELRIKLFW